MTRILALIITIAICTTSCKVQNDSDSKSANQKAIPIGSKFTIELTTSEKGTIDYKITDMQKIDFAIDFAETDTLFSKTPKAETIECFFAKGVDQSGPFKSVLVLRNNTKKIINYEAHIKYRGREGFYKTSTYPLYPGAISTELWNDVLVGVVLKGFDLND